MEELTEGLQNQEQVRVRKDKLLELKQRAEKDGYFPTLLNTAQIASRLELSVATVREAIKQGKLNAYDIGVGKRKDYRSTTMDVLEYITRKHPKGIGRILKQRQIELKVEELTDIEGLIKKYQIFAGARRDDKTPTNEPGNL